MATSTLCAFPQRFATIADVAVKSEPPTPHEGKQFEQYKKGDYTVLFGDLHRHSNVSRCSRVLSRIPTITTAIHARRLPLRLPRDLRPRRAHVRL